jgi:hypothetical protein
MLTNTTFKSYTRLTVSSIIEHVHKRGYPAKKILDSAKKVVEPPALPNNPGNALAQQGNNAATDLQVKETEIPISTIEIIQPNTLAVTSTSTITEPPASQNSSDTTVKKMLASVTSALKYGSESEASLYSNSNNNSKETPSQNSLQSSTDTERQEVDHQFPAASTTTTHNAWTSESKTGVDFSKSEVQRMKKTVMNYDPRTTDNAFDERQPNDNKVPSSESSFEQATNSDAMLTEKAFRIHTPLVTSVEEIGTTQTSVEDHAREIDKLLKNAEDKGIIKYSDAPNNPNQGTIKLSREANQLYNSLSADKKESGENPIELSEQSLQVGTVAIEDSTIITRPDQEHLVVVLKNDKLIGVGILTSKEVGPTKIADKQPFGDLKPDGTPKPQGLLVFKNPYEIAKEDFEIDHVATDFIQDADVTQAVHIAVAPILSLAPIPYDPVGITEKQLEVIMALKEVNEVEEAIKKEAKPKNFLTEEEDKKQALKKEKAEKNKLKQKEAHEKTKKATLQKDNIQNDANTN